MRVEAQGLRVALGSREVLSGLDFSAHPGEVTAVIGPNGAGKTTLLRAVAGLLPVAAGTVAVDGRAIADWQPQALARALAYLPQERVVHWALSARAIVALGRLPYRPMGAGESASRCGARSTRRWRPSMQPIWPSGRCWRCRAASARAFWLPARWRSSRACCSRTSR